MAFRTASSEIRNPDGSVVFQAEGFEVPAEWSQVATDILAQKYFRKAGVPARLAPVAEQGLPPWLWRRTADPWEGGEGGLAALAESVRHGSETSARQVFDRMAGAWAYWGWKGGYFDAEDDARAFYDEIRLMLARQIGAPNSPQWDQHRPPFGLLHRRPGAGAFSVCLLHLQQISSKAHRPITPPRVYRDLGQRTICVINPAIQWACLNLKTVAVRKPANRRSERWECS